MSEEYVTWEELRNYEINHEKLSESLERQETGAIEFALLQKILDRDPPLHSSVELLAYIHRQSVPEYLERIIGYLLSTGILYKVPWWRSLLKKIRMLSTFRGET